MGFEVINDRLFLGGAAVPFAPTPNKRGRIVPEGITIHETAGHLTAGSSLSWLLNPKANVSAHLVIERDGSVTQLAEFDEQCWHAGKSSWRGRPSCNRYMIGIELVGPGKLICIRDRCVAEFGAEYNIPDYHIENARTASHGDGWWMPFTDAQIAVTREICAALRYRYNIAPDNIVGHFEISPGRKVDPNPLLDLDALRSAPDAIPSEIDPFPLAFAPGIVRKAVFDLQLRLIELGYDLGAAKADGRYGARTRNAVLAWEAEQNRPTDGKIDKDDYDAIMREDAKEMPITPVAAEAGEQKAKAAQSIDKTAAVSLSVLSVSALGSDELWAGMISGIDRLSQAVSKLAGLGVKVPASLVLTALAAAVVIALWRWASKLKGEA